MITRFHLVFLVFLLTNGIFAQSNLSIKGSVTDTLDNPLIQATVLLLERKDSTMVDYTRCELDGSFKFKDVGKGDYVVKTTYVGFLPMVVKANTLEGKSLDLGQIKMNELAEELMTVVIKAAKAPIVMKGDTIEYDASTFKVPEGSTVEDLLRRLPGIDVEQDGSILADGKNVNRVTVDGKSFFGSDPKAATKNLPAEGISKVQVYDTETAEQEITGIKSGESDKTMNLELKEEFKKGGFGKIVGGYGTKERAELKGNYNKFNDKIQFSLVGVGNNTGRNGLSWDDYRDFMGSQSFNFGNDLDFGFGGSGRTFYFGGGNNGIESSIQSLFFLGGENGGLPENYNGGASFNYDHNKTKISSVYFYNQSGLNKETVSEQSKFYEDFTTLNKSTNDESTNFQGHRLELSFEKEIDTLHSFEITADGALVDQFEASKVNASQFRDNNLSNNSDFDNNLNRRGYLGRSSFLFRKKFRKKGRSSGFNVSYLGSELDVLDTQDSETEFLLNPSNLQTRYSNDDLAKKNMLKANALYVEPLAQKIFWKSFYNYSDRNESGSRVVKDFDEIDGLLSRSYNNDILLNRAGSSILYSYDGYNISIGMAYQTFNLEGDYESLDKTVVGTIDKQFNNWLPYFNIDISPQRNLYLDAGYSREAREPEIVDLQPIVDTRNPLYIREGNPALTPELSNTISVGGSKNWPLAAVRFYLNGSYSFYDSQFSTSEIVDENLVSYVTPINVDGGRSASVYSNVSFPIVKNKLTVRVNSSFRFGNRPSFVNNIQNNTKQETYSPSVRLTFTPSNDFSFIGRASYRINNTSYDIASSQDQNIVSNEYSLTLNTKLFAKVYLNSTYDYNIFRNESLDFSQNYSRLNFSLYRNFLPENKLEIRVSVYDALNTNQSIRQSAFGNSVNFSSSNVIGRYAMLSLSYNIRGMKGGIQKNRGWW